MAEKELYKFLSLIIDFHLPRSKNSKDFKVGVKHLSRITSKNAINKGAHFIHQLIMMREEGSWAYLFPKFADCLLRTKNKLWNFHMGINLFLQYFQEMKQTMTRDLSINLLRMRRTISISLLLKLAGYFTAKSDNDHFSILSKCHWQQATMSFKAKELSFRSSSFQCLGGVLCSVSYTVPWCPMFESRTGTRSKIKVKIRIQGIEWQDRSKVQRYKHTWRARHGQYLCRNWTRKADNGGKVSESLNMSTKLIEVDCYDSTMSSNIASLQFGQTEEAWESEREGRY